MERFIHKKMDPNEIPIIFVRDTYGHVQQKVSVNEWTTRYSPASLNELEIKLYRQALDYYTEKEYSKAIDLLRFLIVQTGYTHFEYIERLAILYQIIGDYQEEYQLLTAVLNAAPLISLPLGLVKKVEKRLVNVKESLYTKDK